MLNRKNILVTNDDGIDAIGIHKLAEALSCAGNVYVCSPHVQQSATSHGITIGRPVYIEDVSFGEAKHALSMTGTPADCVKIGLQVYRDRGVEMDMVFSGFNHGHNLGSDTLYSGTVAAAIEGAICGLPSAAMSISLPHSNHRAPKHFETAMDMAAKIAKSEMFSKRLCENPEALDINYINENHVILNVNIPDYLPDEIRGVKVCPLSYRVYEEGLRADVDAEGRSCYYHSGWPQTTGNQAVDESDVVANGLGYITITPLHFNLSFHEMIETMRGEWNKG